MKIALLALTVGVFATTTTHAESVADCMRDAHGKEPGFSRQQLRAYCTPTVRRWHDCMFAYAKAHPESDRVSANEHCSDIHQGPGSPPQSKYRALEWDSGVTEEQMDDLRANKVRR